MFYETYWLTGKDGYSFVLEKDVCAYIPKKVKLEKVIVLRPHHHDNGINTTSGKTRDKALTPVGEM